MQQRTLDPSTPVLVTGGTGTLGRQIVRRLREAGRPVRVIARRPRPDALPEDVAFVQGDLSTGAGLDEALAGVEVVVHCAGSTKGDGLKARTLAGAAARAGVRHLVFISVVGADRIPMAGRFDRMAFGYFGSKRSAELAIESSGIPWTTLRATQFFDLTLRTAEALAKLPVVPVPAGLRFQPVDSGEVADRLAELALGEPQGLVGDFGGPRPAELAELFRTYLAAAGRSRRIVEVKLPGRAAEAIRNGAALAPEARLGQRTWEEFLAAKIAAASSPRSAPAGREGA
jgi:uncharacterized protein YbjT (DUF2867 family)